MSELKQQFEAMLARVKSGDVDLQPNNQQKLQLYGLYKQATVGDVTGDAPSDMIGKAKHNAWSKLQGMDSDEAMQNYIDFFS